MKKLLPLGLVVTLTLLPTLAFAAYNDVSIAEGTRLSINGIIVNVIGSSNLVPTITVSDTSFSFVLPQNSTIKISAPSYNQLNNDNGNIYISAAECKVDSSFTTFYNQTANEPTITVTPSTTLCPRSNAATGGNGSGSAGGNVVTTITPVVISPNSTMAELQAKLNTLLAQLKGLASGTPQPSVAPGIVTAAQAHITQILSRGSKGSSVKGLQQFLNNHGFVITTSGDGSPGKESDSYGSLTQKAVGKFQEKYGIAKPGSPGYGQVGPKTLAKINELAAKDN